MKSTHTIHSIDVRVLIVSMCLSLTILAIAPSPVCAAPNYVGINISAPSDWCADQTFADVMLSSGQSWKTIDGSRAANLDANGWPVENAKAYVWANASNMNGTYTLYCPAQVAFTCWGDGTVSNQSYNTSTGFTTATVTVTTTGNSVFELWIENVPSTGVKYVKMIRPGCDTTDIFSKQFLACVSRFSGIRFMDFTATNANSQTNWSDRVLPTQSQNQSGTGYGWQGKGAAWEYAIALCNKAGKDGWICVPAKATNSYIDSLAHLWRDGDNGYAGLRSDLKLYVENCNELWNFGSAFDQSAWNHDSAQAEVAAGNSPLAFDGNTDEWTVTERRIAYRATQISLIFRSVFGDAQMMTRIRPVLEWQQDGGWVAPEADFVEQYYGAVRTDNPVAHPVSYFFWGGSGSAYYNPDNNSDALTLSNIWSSQTMDTSAWDTAEKTDEDWAAAYGLHRTAYEGGPSMDNTGHSEAIKAQAIMDPRMETCTVQHHDFWSHYGGDMVFYLTMVGDYQWGFADIVTDLTTPKMLAVDSLNRTQCAPITTGKAIPATVAGANWDITSKWGTPSTSGGQDIAASYWYSYTLRCSQAAVYSFTPHFNGSTTIEIRVDGVLKTTQTTAFTDTLIPGLHSYRVKSLSGDPTLNSIDVQLISVVGTTHPMVTAMTNQLSITHRGNLVAINGLENKPVSVCIQNLSSQIVNRYSGIPQAGETTISVRDCAPGTYLVSVCQGSRRLAVRMSVMR